MRHSRQDPAQAPPAVKLRRLGLTNLEVTEVGLGTLKFGNEVDEATAFGVLDTAYEAGVRFVDTADIYPPPAAPLQRGNAESILGQWLSDRRVRDQVVLATKVGKPTGEGSQGAGLSAAHIRRACDESLRRLKTSYVDLYQAHVPDPKTPVDETLRAFDDLVRAGKVRVVGCSNYGPMELLEALATSAQFGIARFESYQGAYNLWQRDIERTLLPLCRAYGLGVLVYSPLAGGRLTAAGGLREHPNHPISILQRQSALRGYRLECVALSWLLSQSAVTSAIVGASRPEQLTQTLGSLDDTLLDEGMRAACEVFSQ